ncbi:hypothetical protein [Neobacillus kokaensis]|uniref:Alanine dehydrogenase/pyridine nucleotide transhydrogenase N-terminal domain-containing protein n=1 Tax=Neobacillus kokaensis TaxID=2759023 RepID=A0ABQ3N5N8_9BACI|nr:hypothetical protein [Neobacillus kokaensis]GHH98832.1 hypothetical protein AM1BK_23750 [Neobacillus kokaensis]
MIIGVPKEITNNENRVAITPAGVTAVKNAGHQVIIEAGAGRKSGFTDEEYMDVGAFVSEDARGVWENVNMILKVNKPLPSEYQFFRGGLIIFAQFKLDTAPKLADMLIQTGVIAISFETVESNQTFPSLTPISDVAGRIQTSTIARTNATLPYILEISNIGLEKAISENLSLTKWVNIANGYVTCYEAAESLGLEYTSLKDAFRVAANK